MANFTPTSCFKLADHSIDFTNSGIEIRDSTSKIVYEQKYSTGFAAKAVAGDFCIGTLSMTDSFTVVLDDTNPNWGIRLVSNTGVQVLGSDEIGFPLIDQNEWEITECPVFFKTEPQGGIGITCPCSTVGQPCTNKCYRVYQI